VGQTSGEWEIETNKMREMLVHIDGNPLAIEICTWDIVYGLCWSFLI